MARIVPRACILVVMTASGLAQPKVTGDANCFPDGLMPVAEAAAEVLARPASAGYRVIPVKEVRWLWGDVCVGRHRPDTQSGSWTDPYTVRVASSHSTGSRNHRRTRGCRSRSYLSLFGDPHTRCHKLIGKWCRLGTRRCRQPR